MPITNLDNWNSLKKVRRIDFDSGQFEANGKIYFLESQLTTSRFCDFQILQRELGMGMTLEEIHKGFKDARALLNQQRFVDIAVFIDKVVNNCSKLKEKEPVLLKIATLFCNTEDEDRTKWSNDTVVKKKIDWDASGIDVQDFFEVALTLSPGFIETYNAIIRSISDNMEVVAAIVNAQNPV